jgi:two-component system, NtrC family, response regulator AtoC
VQRSRDSAAKSRRRHRDAGTSSLEDSNHAAPGFTGRPSRFRLLVVGKTRMESFRFPSVGPVTIGRAADCALTLDDASVGEHHAHLELGSPMTLVDLGSGHPTMVGAQRLEPGVPVAVSPGMVITIGVVILALQSTGPSTRLRHIRSHDYFVGRLEDECARVELAGSFGVARFACTSAATSALEGAFTDCLRAMDVVAMYSRDEYEVLLVDVAPDDARAIVDLVCARIRAAGSDVTAGLACYPCDARTPEGLVTAAGDSLHGATRSTPPAIGNGVIEQLRPLLERLAKAAVPVLVVGETGVGKEVMTNAIHQLSPRAAKPLLCINCAAMTETLLESELFGYERGAFTGAVQAKAGLLETAEGGTVFLDEVGEMPLSVQAKLLRVLEQKQVTRLGGLVPRSIDVRFIAATNRDLEAQVACGAFRRDLYFRLNGFMLAIPPLRERVGEIEPLVRVFIEEACVASHRERRPEISRDALALLQSYSWPGNVRELRNLIERAVLLYDSAVIERHHLSEERLGRTLPATHLDLPMNALMPSRPPPSPEVGRESSPPPPSRPYVPPGGTLDERERIVRALEDCAGNQTKAAQILGIARRTFVTRVESYRLPRPKKPS